MTIKFFKNLKNPYCWATLPYLGENELSWKKGLSVFKYYNIYHHAINLKKLFSHSQEKFPAEGQTDRGIDREG